MSTTTTPNAPLLPKKEGLQKALHHYALLDDEQKKIIDEKEIEGSLPAQEWLQKFTNLIDYDFWADEYLKHYPQKYNDIGCLAGGMIFYGFVYLFVAIGVLPEADAPFYMYILLASPPILYFAITTILNRVRKLPQLRRQDLPNYFREFIIPLLRIFKEEMRPERPLTLYVNMQKPIVKEMLRTNRPHLLEAEKEPYNDSKNTKFFVYTVLKIKGKLLNGVVIDFDLTYIIRERFRYKRKGNKYKLRARGFYTLKMIVPKRRFEAKKLFPQNIRVEQNDTHYIFKMKKQVPLYHTKVATKGNKNLEYWTLEQNMFNENLPQMNTILGMIQTIYQHFSLLKKA